MLQIRERKSCWPLAVMLLAACSPAPKTCDTSSCPFGCCDQGGVCQTGSVFACGDQGSACVACSTGQLCQVGRCVGSASGGGVGGGVGGGGGGASGSGGGGGQGGPLTFESSYRALWDGVCAYSTRCGLYDDVGACLRREGRVPPISPTLKVVVNSTRAERCLASLRSSPCAAAIGGTDYGRWAVLLTPECAPASGDLLLHGSVRGMPFQHLLDGLVQPGGSCRDSLECLPDAWCDTSASCPGTCQPRLPVGLADGPGKCQRGLTFEDLYPPAQCVAIPREGEVCAVTCAGISCTRACEAGLSCGGAGTCERPLSALGRSCSSNFGCPSPLVCRSGACGAAARENELCSSTECALGLTCEATNLCTAALRPGQPCNPASSRCDVGLRCQAVDGGSAVCSVAQPIPTGSSCAGVLSQVIGCVSTDYCSSSDVCARQKGPGMTCAGYTECAPGLSCSGGQCTGCPAEW